MGELMRSSEGEVDKPCQPPSDHVPMDSPPPHNTNVGESHYVPPHGPTIEVNYFIPNISTFSFFKLHKYAN